MVNVDGRQIAKISAEGLTYIDEKSIEAFIDFSACYANYLARLTETEHLKGFKELNHMDDEQLTVWLKNHEKWKQVAERDITGGLYGVNSPFIEFHTIPAVRFTFAVVDEFHRVRYVVEKFGWRTSDLS